MTFEIYLVRHGLAGQFGDYEDDAVRPLTEDGVKKTRKVLDCLNNLNLRFDRILTSPYQRAYQTAKILQDISLSKSIEIFEALQPEGDEVMLVEHLMQTRAEGLRIAIVGHEPDLSQLASQLIFGNDSANLTLKKAGIIGITAPIEGDLIGKCQLFWLAPPRLLLG
jgi:phosphohistidine phosphatase